MSDAEDNLMIRRELNVTRNAPHVWSFVREMGNWASLMPGYISHEHLGDDDSLWTLQVDIGPFKRPVAIDVHVLLWDEPHHVAFEIKGRHDPFRGSGTFTSEEFGHDTRITLEFRAEPTGSMAKLLVPLIPPILRRVADHFTANLQQALDPGKTHVPLDTVSSTPPRGFWAWLISRFLPRKTV